MLGLPSKWPQYETADGYIRIKKEEEYLRLSCPSAFSNFPHNYTIALCEGENDFKVKGNLHKYSDLKCTEEIKHEVRETRKECFHNDTEWIKVGFIVFNNFLPVYDVCLDKKNKMPIYTKHSLDRYLAEVAPESPNWIVGDLPFNFDEIYDCNNQTTSISGDLNKWFHDEDGCCFKKRQLVNPRDVPPGLAQTATYNYINVAPQWSTCGNKVSLFSYYQFISVFYENHCGIDLVMFGHDIYVQHHTPTYPRYWLTLVCRVLESTDIRSDQSAGR